MKKIFIPSLLLMSIFLIGGLMHYNNKPTETLGYTNSSLPTTIDLNDNSEEEIKEYYSDLSELSSSELQGENLLKNLKPILKNNQKYFKYDDDSIIWKLYEISDRDWTKSPATEITGYNASTNTITGYRYGTSNSSPGSDPYVRALYYNRDQDLEIKAWGDHAGSMGINREHIWPKSQGFNDEGAGGARGDPMHLWPANPNINTAHSNLSFGFVTPSEKEESDYYYLSGNYSGTSLNIGTQKVFEPQDSDKGDVARAIFYMAARYNYLSGSDTDGINTNNPNLEIVQDDISLTSYTSTTSNTGKIGILSDLLEWHRLDPVDEFEIHRNNLLYNNFTNNRNPFIDFPEWVDYIWGTATYDGASLISYNSTPTGYVNLDNDVVNGYIGEIEIEVNVSGISLNVNKLTLDIDDTYRFTHTISPSNATNVGVTYTSSNPSVASVNNYGSLTALSAGSTIITVTTKDGGYTATCNVTVNEKVIVEGEVISTLNNANTYNGTDNTYKDWTYEDTNVGVKYVGNSAGGNSTIQLRTNNSNSGIVTTSSNNIIKDISLEWYASTSNERKVNVYGSNTPYTSPSNLYNESTWGTLIGQIAMGIEDPLTFDKDYKYIGIRSFSGALYLNEINITYYENGSSGDNEEEDVTITSISASTSKTFNVGDTISKNDIDVVDNNGNAITDFTFDDYRFKYEDANSGGEATLKELNVVYGELNTTLDTCVSRKAPSDSKVDTLTRETTDVTGTSYTSWSNKTVSSSSTYAGHSAGGNSSIQLRSSKTDSSGEYSGVISTTSGGILSKVEVSWNTNTTDSRTLNIYGSNSPYTSPNDLYSETTCGTLLGSLVYSSETSPQTTLNIEDSYQYIGIRSKSGALFLSSISISYGNSDDLGNLVNYIMYEDTNNQCLTKLDTAIDMFNNLNDKSTFMTSDDYCISTARNRLLAWLNNQNKTITYNDDTYVVATYINNNILDINNSSTSLTFIIVLTISSISLTFIYVVKRKH